MIILREQGLRYDTGYSAPVLMSCRDMDGALQVLKRVNERSHSVEDRISTHTQSHVLYSSCRSRRCLAYVAFSV